MRTGIWLLLLCICCTSCSDQGPGFDASLHPSRQSLIRFWVSRAGYRSFPEDYPEQMLRELQTTSGEILAGARAFRLRGEYGPDVLNRFAIDFIDRHKDQRFFLYYPMKLPHAPVLPTPDSDDEPSAPQVE